MGTKKPPIYPFTLSNQTQRLDSMMSLTYAVAEKTKI